MNGPLKALALAAVFTASALGQTLSQSTNNTTITAGASIACAQGGGTITVDNGYFRSYPLATLGTSIDIVSVRFGIELVTTTLVGGFPLQIRLYNDPNGGAPSPFASLVLRHTENFTVPPTATGVIHVQAITGPTVTFAQTETLVVEIFSPTGAVSSSAFFIGSNALGQTAPGYLRATGCGIPDPVTLAGPPINAPNMHMILDVNYVPSGQGVMFPGTNEDLTLFSAINTNPLSSGIGNTLKTATAGDLVTIKVQSTGGTFNNKELVVLGQPFVTGFPPFPSAAPNIYPSFAGMVLLIGLDFGPLGPVLLPATGATLTFQVPVGLVGASAMFQAAVVTFSPPLALNGIYASTDAHEIQIL